MRRLSLVSARQFEFNKTVAALLTRARRLAHIDTETLGGRVRQAVLDRLQVHVSDVRISFSDPALCSVLHFALEGLRLAPLAPDVAPDAPQEDLVSIFIKRRELNKFVCLKLCERKKENYNILFVKVK